MTPDLSRARWIKSSRSQQATDQCVEIAFVPGCTAVRDSKDPDGTKMIFSNTVWVAFIEGVKNGDHVPTSA